jgi:hypothetical protein
LPLASSTFIDVEKLAYCSKVSSEYAAKINSQFNYLFSQTGS